MTDQQPHVPYNMEGLLWKRARGRSLSSVLYRPWALRWFSFEDGKLTYFAQQQGLSGTQRHSTNLQQRGCLQVENCIVRPAPDATKAYAFVVNGCRNLESNAEESLLLASATETEMLDWMAALSGKREEGPDGWKWVCDRQKPQGQPPCFKKAYSRTTPKLTQLYEVHEKVGSGGFAVVKRGVCKESGQVYALKMIPLSVFKTTRERTEEEVKVLAALDHPGVVKLREVVRTPTHFVIVMEFLRGGELFERIVKKKFYNEHDAKIIAAKILESVRYLHDNDIVHRDVKPENMMFDTASDHAQLKLTDFGFATMYNNNIRLTATCGTPEYVAPEILQEQPYGKAVDMWSLGVVIYILLCGFPPFYGRDEEQLFQRVCRGEYHFLKPYWDRVSKEAKHLVRHLLDINPETRYTAQQALEHPWFNDVVHGEGMGPQSSADLSNVLMELRRYNGYRKFRNGVLAVMAANRMKSRAMKDAFDAFQDSA